MNLWRSIYDLPQSIDPWKNGIPKFALYLDIEPTNHCNFKCKFCVGQQQITRPKGFMDEDLFLKICKQAQKYGCKGIRFLRWGEPLLHKKLSWMIKTAKRHGMLTHVTTNGFFLKEQRIKIIGSCLDSLIVSFQGLNKKEYKKLRNNNYDKIIDNIKKFQVINPNHTWVTASTTVTNESEKKINDWKNKMLKIVDDVSINYTWFKRLKDKSKVQDIIKKSKKLSHIFKCQEVMIKLSIDWDGTISPCCLDYNQQLSLGNIKKDDLMDIWKSKEVKAIRDLLASKRQDLFVLCSTCELNSSFRGKK